ncbi:hypothetical protein BU14_0053s0042 [Porphyra umbilicalis]|uniref:Uncharacterized protein n=1 Tax=Porphyra umbilicalis TaxID=2786 RepID=A0A1X6PHN3_PORUM|nr:hypothetical protein BU14_0053s0042 [Porphyra umbilicalis]|eukprot:OSX80379.1 hypothetical protein BU14_0053s0042 [Porphyra umbilicalis]
MANDGRTPAAVIAARALLREVVRIRGGGEGGRRRSAVAGRARGGGRFFFIGTPPPACGRPRGRCETRGSAAAAERGVAAVVVLPTGRQRGGVADGGRTARARGVFFRARACGGGF